MAAPVEDSQMSVAVKALVERGVREIDARRTLFDIDLDSQPLADQIEWFDDQIRLGSPIKNPPGFLLTCLRENWLVSKNIGIRKAASSWSRTAEMRPSGVPGRADGEKAAEDPELRRRYWDWQHCQIEEEISRRYPGAALRKKLRELTVDLQLKYPNMFEEGSESWLNHAETILRTQLGSAMDLPTFEQFAKTKQPKLFPI